MRVLTVTDLHQRRVLYDQLSMAVEQHRPDVLALVGDFLNVWQHGGEFLSVAECSKRLNALPVEHVICTRGNHEDANWVDFISGRILKLNGGVWASGPLVCVGFPCLLGDETWFLESDPDVSWDASKWFPKLVNEYGPAVRTLWLMHEPPDRTRLSEPGGPLAGNSEWREAIERYSPLLVVSGHDHHTPILNGTWHDEIGETLCLNAGQASTRLHYFVIDAWFPREIPSLPSGVVITHRPTGEVKIVGELH